MIIFQIYDRLIETSISKSYVDVTDVVQFQLLLQNFFKVLYFEFPVEFVLDIRQILISPLLSLVSFHDVVFFH